MSKENDEWDELWDIIVTLFDDYPGPIEAPHPDEIVNAIQKAGYHK